MLEERIHKKQSKIEKRYWRETDRERDRKIESQIYREKKREKNQKELKERD